MRGNLLRYLGGSPVHAFLIASLVEALSAWGSGPALVDYEWTEDFERGTIAGWDSYPPFQDTAYDYSILAGYYRSPETLQGYVASGEFFYPVDLPPPGKAIDNKFYCLRLYRPNSIAAQRIGFSRKCSVFVPENSSIGFDLWVKQTFDSACDLRVILACSDSRRYESWVGMVGNGKWLTLDLALSSFDSGEGSLRPGLEIQAVVIEARFSRGDPATLLHVAIDNVRLKGKRQARFNLENPVVERFDHWPLAMAMRHLDTNDRLSIAATPEVPVHRATARLETIEGAPLGEERQLTFKDPVWTADGFHTFTVSDPTGPLKLILDGQTEEGEPVRTEVRLWRLPSPEKSTHPNLLFKENDLEVLKKRKETERGKEIWDRIRDLAATARREKVPEQGQIEEFPQDYLIQQLTPYFDSVRNTAYGAMMNAWVYALDGDEEAGRYAKDVALKMAGWKTWTHPWFLTQGRKTYYPVGLAAMHLGIAYDLIRPLLSVEEAAAIRKGVIQNGIANAFEEYFVDNRVPNHTSNWISHCTAGPLVALLAFYADAQGEEKAEIDRLFSGLAEKFMTHCKATFTADGGYGEGYGYQSFTLESASPFLAAIENQFGATNLVGSLNIAESYLFPTYISVEGGKTLLDMGDSSNHPGEKTNWAWLSQRLDDPILKGFYHSSPGNDWEDFLWMEDDAKTSGPESLPPSRYFPDKGNVVFRTGWGEGDVVLNYRAGPHFNHTHADQGSFRLWAFGEELVSEAGKAGYYTDPYYWSYFIQSGGHNTILADGISESQEFGDFKNEVVAFDRRAKIENVHLSDTLNVVTSELAPVYRGSHKGHLERLNRTVCFVAPGYVVIRDQLRSVGDQTYQWQLFPPQAEGFSIEGSKAFYKGEKAQLEINALSPDHTTLKALKRPIEMSQYAQFPAAPLHPRVSLLVNGGTAEKGIEFLVALLPTRLDDANGFACEDFEKDGVKGVRVECADWSDEILFDDSRESVSYARNSGGKLVASEEVELAGSSEKGSPR